MNRNRKIGSLAALGGFTAAIALLSGLPSAKADDLSDLRANQELLQRRLDQLAQIPAPASPYPGGPPAASAGQALVGGSFPRSWLIPGTDTSIRVGGEIREVLDYFITGGNPNSSPQSTTLGSTGQSAAAPLRFGLTAAGNPGGLNTARSRSNGIFWQSPRESKINFETRTPTALGEVRTYMEFDWAGSTAFAPGGTGPTNISDNLIPRLRFAYGTLGGLLFGQANSNFSDPDANAENIDFGGNFGEPGVTRIPQVRYTVPLQNYGLLGAFSMSVETAETDAATTIGPVSSDAGAGTTATCPTTGAAGASTTCSTLPGGTAAANPTKAWLPDFTMAWYIPQPWGHFDFSTVARPGLQFNDGAFVRRNFVGYGAHVGLDVKPGWFGFAKDDIMMHIVGGDGIGRYMNASANFALDSNYGSAAPTCRRLGVGGCAAAGAANLIRIKTTREFGGELGYQHWWDTNLRSTVSAGYEHHDIDPFVGATQRNALNKDLFTTHANLIWNPVPFVDVGIEYVYGYRRVANGNQGDMHAIASRFGVKF